MSKKKKTNPTVVLIIAHDFGNNRNHRYFTLLYNVMQIYQNKYSNCGISTEQLHFHFSLSCIGEGNGNLFQCSCLENPRDRGAWWAALYGVAQSQTRLKRLSSKDLLLDIVL